MSRPAGTPDGGPDGGLVGVRGGGAAWSVEHLRGVLPVVSTPFTDSDALDVETLHAEVDWLLANGADGLVIAMVSEVLRLDDAERLVLAEEVVEAAAGRVPVVVSVGTESTPATLRLADAAVGLGAAALMAIPPLAVPLPDDAIAAHYAALLAAVPVPVVVQDASGYVGRALSVDLYAGLLDRFGPDRVLFKPEAEPVAARIAALQERCGGVARVFEGNAGLGLRDSYHLGVVGTMPGPEVPWAIAALWRALEAGDADRVAAVHAGLAPLVALQQGLDGFVAVEKHLLVQQRVLPSARRRHPYGFSLDAATAAESTRLLTDLWRLTGPYTRA